MPAKGFKHCNLLSSATCTSFVLDMPRVYSAQMGTAIFIKDLIYYFLLGRTVTDKLVHLKYESVFQLLWSHAILKLWAFGRKDGEDRSWEAREDDLHRVEVRQQELRLKTALQKHTGGTTVAYRFLPLLLLIRLMMLLCVFKCWLAFGICCDSTAPLWHLKWVSGQQPLDNYPLAIGPLRK